MMTYAELKEIKAELAATTPGEWAIYDDYTHDNVTYLYRVGTDTAHVLKVVDYDEIAVSPADLDFIVRAHNEHVPALLAEVERLRAVVIKFLLRSAPVLDGDNG